MYGWHCPIVVEKKRLKVTRISVLLWICLYFKFWHLDSMTKPPLQFNRQAQTFGIFNYTRCNTPLYSFHMSHFMQYDIRILFSSPKRYFKARLNRTKIWTDALKQLKRYAENKKSNTNLLIHLSLISWRWMDNEKKVVCYMHISFKKWKTLHLKKLLFLLITCIVLCVE